MAHIGISERGHGFSDYLGAALSSFGVCGADIAPLAADESYDAIIISTEAPDTIPECNTDILIIPDCMSAKSISRVSAKSVVSYGLCKKNTLTVSSLIGTRLVVSLQREITTILNSTISEQEFCIDIEHADGIDSFLGIIAALLIADISPETISRVTFDF